MNINDGTIRQLEQLNRIEVIRAFFKNEVLVNFPNPSCVRCKGKGSLKAFGQAKAEERAWAWQRGLPTSANYIPCPQCNPDFNNNKRGEQA